RDKPSNSCCFLFWHLLISFAHGRNYAIIWIVANAYWPGNAHLGSPYDAKAQALSAAKQRLLFGFGCLNEAISKLRIRCKSAVELSFAEEILTRFSCREDYSGIKSPALLQARFTLSGSRPDVQGTGSRSSPTCI